MFKNAMKLSMFDLKVHKNYIIGWCVALFAIMFMYMILFPSVQDMAQVKMDAMPQELLQLVGMSDMDELSNYITYFGIIYNLILIAISIFIVTFSANIIAKEEKNKSIEFIYSLHVSRLEIFVSKVISAYIALMMVIMSVLASTLMCGVINGGDTFDMMEFISIAKVSSITPFFFLGIGIMIASTSAKVSGATLGSFSVIVCYMLGFLSTLLSDNASWIAYFSPFEMLSPTNTIVLDGKTIIAAGVYLLLMIICLILGCIVYKKRDFKI